MRIGCRAKVFAAGRDGAYMSVPYCSCPEKFVGQVSYRVKKKRVTDEGRAKESERRPERSSNRGETGLRMRMPEVDRVKEGTRNKVGKGIHFSF